MSWKSIIIGARTQFLVKVSPEDYDYLMQWRWTYARSHGQWSGLIYARRCETVGGIKTTILMHRLIVARMGVERPSPHHFVDHRNGDSLDNRRTNDQGRRQLRWLTAAENMAARKLQGTKIQVPLPPEACDAAIAATF